MLRGLPLLWMSLAAAAAEPDFGAVCGDAERILEEMIAIDTSNPPGHEAKVAWAASRRLSAAGVSSTVVESAPGRGNVIARVAGDGSKRPLLFLAHIDVVGAGPLWSTPPFSLTRKDGYLWGRGVGDDKGMAAIGVAIARDLARRRVALARDVIVALTADEESGGDAGVIWLLKNKPELLRAEFALNEGAGARLVDGKLQFVGLQTAEKTYRTYFLEVEGPGGHSSVPVPDNAIYRLSAVLGRLSAHAFPARLTDTTRAWFSGLAAHESPAVARDMKALVSAKSPPRGAVQRLEKTPHFNSILRTTCVATMVQAGHRENALPQQAKATVNCRILPGDEAGVQAALERVIADARVKVVADRSLGAAPPSPVDGPVLEAARKTAAVMSPGVPVLPSLSTRATDSRHLRAAGIPAYGLKPFPANDDDARRAHGRDERVLETSLRYGCEFLYRTVLDLAAAR